MTLAVPLPLCFCFFLIVFTVTSLPLCQSISHLPKEEMNNEKVWKSADNASRYCLRSAHPSQSMISGPSNENGSSASGSDFILYTFVRTELVKYSLGSKWNSNVKLCVRKRNNEIHLQFILYLKLSDLYSSYDKTFGLKKSVHWVHFKINIKPSNTVLTMGWSGPENITLISWRCLSIGSSCSCWKSIMDRTGFLFISNMWYLNITLFSWNCIHNILINT